MFFLISDKNESILVYLLYSVHVTILGKLSD